jgi:hypothetical protein
VLELQRDTAPHHAHTAGQSRYAAAGLG